MIGVRTLVCRAARLYQRRVYRLINERTIERMSMIENAIRKIRSHFVLLGSVDLVVLFF
jgi:hypothetical protein